MQKELSVHRITSVDFRVLPNLTSTSGTSETLK